GSRRSPTRRAPRSRRGRRGRSVCVRFSGTGPARTPARGRRWRGTAAAVARRAGAWDGPRSRASLDASHDETIGGPAVEVDGAAGEVVAADEDHGHLALVQAVAADEAHLAAHAPGERPGRHARIEPHLVVGAGAAAAVLPNEGVLVPLHLDQVH